MRLNVTNVKLFQEATFEKAQVPNMLSLEVPGLAENRPSLLKGDKIFARVEDGTAVGVVLDAFADANVVTEGAVDASTILLTSAVSLSTASSRSRTRSASRRPLKRAPSISKNDFYGYTVSPFNENIPRS